MAEVPYDPIPQPGWKAEVESWTWQPLDERSWRKSGRCPRCKHNMTVDYTISTVTDFLPSLRRRAKRRRNLARCNCGVEHPGRPTEEPKKQDMGCGQQANIAPPET